MIRVMFVCWGNICRSPMAEFVLMDMVYEQGMADRFDIASCAISDEEWGNGIYPQAMAKMNEKGIGRNPCLSAYENGSIRQRMMAKKAIPITEKDCNVYDYVLVMEPMHKRQLERRFGNACSGKIHCLLDYCHEERGIEDPWYTRDFEKAYRDIHAGCLAFLRSVTGEA